jgi:hypothetical protein
VPIYGLAETGRGITEVMVMCNKTDIGQSLEEEEPIKKGDGTEGVEDQSGNAVIGIDLSI